MGVWVLKWSGAALVVAFLFVSGFLAVKYDSLNPCRAYARSVIDTCGERVQDTPLGAGTLADTLQALLRNVGDCAAVAIAGPNTLGARMQEEIGMAGCYYRLAHFEVVGRYP